MNMLLRRGVIILAFSAASHCFANNWPTSTVSASASTIAVGQQVVLTVTANDVDGDLYYIDVDQISPNAGYYGAGYNTGTEYPPGGSAWSLGSPCTNASRVLTLTIGTAGTYVFNGYAADNTGSGWQPTSNTVTVTVTSGTAPSITAHPQSDTKNLGFDVVMGVTASGSASLIYQWKKNGANITAATNVTLTLLNISATDAASYTVVVSNTAGTATSNAAVLTVRDPNADSDGDGIPNLTETALGTSSSTTTNDSSNTQQQLVHRPTS